MEPQQQQPMSQYRAATPVLYGSTFTAFTYGHPRDAQTISALAGGDIVFSSLGLEYNGESTREESGAFEDYGERSYQGDEMATAMKMVIRLAVIRYGMINNCLAPWLVSS